MDIGLYSLFDYDLFNKAAKTAVNFGGVAVTDACIVGGVA